MKVEVVTPEDYSGDVIGDLNRRRGQITGMDDSPAGKAILAEVPLSAIFQRGAQPAVWVVDKTSGTVDLRAVTVARWRNDTAAIVSGVTDGELIATAGVHKLEAGQKVKPVQTAVRP